MNKLHIIGSIHVDLMGEERLTTVLNALKPDIIALEMHKERENLIKDSSFSAKNLKKLITNIFDEAKITLTRVQQQTLGELAGEFSKILIPFELKCIRKYIKTRKNTHLKYVDIKIGETHLTDGMAEILKSALNATPPKAIKQIQQLLDKGKDNITASYCSGIDGMYENEELLSLSVSGSKAQKKDRKNLKGKALATHKKILHPSRDKTMASNIRKLCANGNCVVAVVGFGHLTSLKEKLADLNPQCDTLLGWHENIVPDVDIPITITPVLTGNIE